MKKFEEFTEFKKNIFRKFFTPFASYLKSHYRELFCLWEDLGLHITHNNFYEPVPDTRKISNECKIYDFNMLQFIPEKQLNIFLNLSKKYKNEWKEILLLNKGKNNFYIGNGLFDGVDAYTACMILREYKPEKILEIGSGFSTKLFSFLGGKNKNFEITCIDPYANDDILSLDCVKKVIKKPVEKIAPDFFTELREGDLLFIDSSHIVSMQNDVVYMFLEVLPKLNKGVLIHVHDVFLPLDYPISWVKEDKRFWNEQYILAGFLINNNRFKTLISNSLLGYKYPEILKKEINLPNNLKEFLEKEFKRMFPGVNWWGGGSFWGITE